MSHFTVYVFGEDVEELLAPYDENMEMSPYVAYTRAQAIAESKRRIEDYKNGTYAEYLKDPDAYKERYGCSEEDAHIKYLKNEFPKHLEWTDDEHYEDMAQWYKENDMIDDDGNLLSTYNPNSKWDWWSVGGRWQGCLNLTTGHKVNEAQVYEVDWDATPLPFAFITPDGEWHERGEMGWWACVSNEKDKDAWETEYRNAVKALADEDICVTVVDCHI